MGNAHVNVLYKSRNLTSCTHSFGFLHTHMECTTANVPREITHFTREKISPDNALMEGWIWSRWMLVMTPDWYNSDFRRRETQQCKRPGYKITKAEFKRQFAHENKSCGVYEWMARHAVTREEYVVYIGSTCRNKSGNFIDRIYEYCTDGAHKANLIDDALQNGYELLVRYKGSGDISGVNNRNKTSAECDENTILKHFDYAWNTRSVKSIERRLP